MSVMFKALHKAARDYRDQNFPVTVPLMPLTAKDSVRVRLMKTGLIFLLAAAGAATGISWFYTRSHEPSGTFVAANIVAPSVEPAPAPSHYSTPVFAAVTENLQQVQKPETAESTAAQTSEEGITLPVEGLAVPPVEVKAAKNVEQELRDSPVFAAIQEKPAVRRKTLAPEITVKDPDEKPAAGLVRDARRLVKEGKYGEAITLYDKALEKDGNNQEAWAGKIYVLQQSGLPEALGELEKMAALRPFSAPVFAAKAHILSREKRSGEAVDSWRRALELEPSNKKYILGLAVLYDHMGKTAEALDAYGKMPSPLPRAVRERMEYLSLVLEGKNETDESDSAKRDGKEEETAAAGDDKYDFLNFTGGER